ncbi:hypothetical protein MANES_03G068716v8 [Manihot esculenta]|uniref:Uncharacterized protein n=1 Tax=Manihot esculenta TaxID=3983 RepID=A0ACB7HXT0_MANES|nr:hypothetical protein MANES_03G068716v8 [Manihot esculenta]
MKASPYIDLRIKILRGKYYAIAEMRGPSYSGFGWNERKKCITYDNDVWDKWVKSHPYVVGLRNRSFSFYDELDYIYKKDRGTRKGAKNPIDAIEEIDLQEHDQ